MKHTELIERLRGVVQKLRRTPMPIAEVAPMVSEAADAIEALQSTLARIEEKVDYLIAERDALKLDAERYRELLCYHFAEIADLLGVAYGNYTAEGDIKNGIDKHLDEAMKGAA